MSSPHSVEDWKARIEPHLSTSLQEASDAIMRTDRVQTWLRKASTEAAEGLGPGSGMQGEMQGYIQLKNALKDQFPALLDAVDELTEGCGEVDLDWRPLNPTQSHVQVTFDREFTVQLFVRLTDPTSESTRGAIQTVAHALPEGTPFPNRPNTVTGLVGHDESCVGVRVREHLGEDRQRRYRTVTLLPDTRDDLDKLSEQEAANRLRQLFAPTDSSSVV
jgi:hypothetical protein